MREKEAKRRRKEKRINFVFGGIGFLTGYTVKSKL